MISGIPKTHTKTKENFMYIIEGVSEVEQWMKHHLWKAMKVNLSYKYMTTVGSKSGALGCYAVVLKRKPCCFVLECNLQANLCGMSKVIENEQ